MIVKRAGTLWAFNQIVSVSQWLFSALLGLIISYLFWPNTNPAIGITLSAGFMGGHGSASVVGGILTNLGWEDGFALGLTFATIGIFLSISIGMLILQIAVKLGWIDTFTSFACMGQYQRKGLISPENQQTVMKDTMSSLSVDSFAIHAALVLAFSYLSASYFSSFFQQVQVPTFVTGFLGGMLVRYIANQSKANNFLCDGAFNHASGISTDYLIIFGVSSIKITVLANYLLPMIILSFGGVLFTLWLVLGFVA
jgi:ESS family glutamate:Na+ symporter